MFTWPICWYDTDITTSTTIVTRIIAIEFPLLFILIPPLYIIKTS